LVGLAETLRHRFRIGYAGRVVEVLSQHRERWPDKDSGPLTLSVTIAIVDGRPQPIGVEVWAVHPAALEKWVTGMTRSAAEQKWGQVDPDAEPAAIRTVDLRLPLGRMVEDAVNRERRTAGYIAAGAFARQGNVAEWTKAPRVKAHAKRVLELTEPEPPKPRGRRPLPRSHYEEVAAVYREALRDNRDPTQAVKDYFIVSKSQAAKWIWRCRREPLNLLDPTVRGRAAGGTEEN